MEILSNALAIVMVVLGIGFVIFIHELGHFLLAKWNGVKVEKFAIGFDLKGLKLYSKKVGETEYVLGAIPLGGYVKMLGEDMTGGVEEGAEPVSDPRAYHNRPVGARMAIITAGVIMNMIFGVFCFAYIYMRGKPEVPPVVGAVVAGGPAYEAGLRSGDRVIAVDGTPIATFDELVHASVFSSNGQVLKLDARRPGVEAPLRFEVRPTRKTDDLAPTIGIASSDSLELFEEGGYEPPPGVLGDASGVGTSLATGGRIVAAGPAGGKVEPVETSSDLDRVLLAHRAGPIDVRVEREDGQAAKGASSLTVTLPPNRFVDLGLRLAAGPIEALRPFGPAAKAGLKIGDRIVAVDGVEDFDPMRLPDAILERAKAEGSPPVVLRVLGAGEEEPRTVELRPTAAPTWTESRILSDEPLDVPGLGMAIGIVPEVTGVVPGGPAAKLGVKANDSVRAVTVRLPAADSDGEAGRAETIRVVGPGETPGRDGATWPFVFDLLQQLPRHKVEVQLARAGAAKDAKPETLAMTPEPVEGWFNPHRGLRLTALMDRLPPQGIPQALVSAWGETMENAGSIFLMIRGLFQQRLSKDAAGGIPKIAHFAYNMARRGLDWFIPFLGMLSVNLAVINFFPIPPLDGGQFLLLLTEKLRGRPLPERYVTPITLAGLVLLLALILFVNINDIVGYLF